VALLLYRPSNFASVNDHATGYTVQIFICKLHTSGFGGLGVACWPLVPKFAGSNLAEAVGFLRAKKSSAHLPLEGK
jgi:hypothetical protein